MRCLGYSQPDGWERLEQLTADLPLIISITQPVLVSIEIMTMKPLDCKGEVNKCKIDIADNRNLDVHRKNEALRELIRQISRMGKRRRKRGK